MNLAADIVAKDLRITAPRTASILVKAAQFRLPAGKISALVGPNGAGKSSLVRGIGGILPVQGQITLGPHDLTMIKPRQRAQLIGVQPQGRPSAEGLSAEEYVAASLGAQIPWLSGLGQEEREKIDGALGACHAQAFATRRLSSLSGGEAAKIALAATLVGGAKWLILDEPAASLDPGAAHVLRVFLHDLVAHQGYSIAIVEHDLAAAKSFADHVLLIAAGELVAEGAPEEVLEESRLSALYGAEIRFLDDQRGGFALAIGGGGGR